ncbi:MAG: hypothetical protein KKA79_03030 [Nanoarchaeota archaeon]|nr:hypothetical protein [Nanoarchaeota archaeon]MCG2717725.1 hypothetical protein [Nanoarchaeota archaeon]
MELHIKSDDPTYDTLLNIIEGKRERTGWKTFMPKDYKDEIILENIPFKFKKLDDITFKDVIKIITCQKEKDPDPSPFKKYEILEDKTLVLYDKSKE